ncbi:MAG: DUF6634 family protein [Pseudomonadota bacterium]
MEDKRKQMLTALEEAEAGPTERELLDAPMLNPWRLELWSDHFRLYGECEDHPDIDDRHVTTSPLLALNANAGWARSRSRWYKVGPDFQTTEPDKTSEILKEVDQALATLRFQVRAGLQMTHS